MNALLCALSFLLVLALWLSSQAPAACLPSFCYVHRESVMSSERIQIDPAAHADMKAAPASLASLKFAATVGQIALVLMRSRQHRHSFLSDFETLVMPAVTTSQLMLAEGRDAATGLVLPSAVVLYAQVSE